MRLKDIKQGVTIRSVGSLVMWLFALFAFWVNEIRISHFIGVSCSVLFLVLLGPLTLFTLKRVTGNNTFANVRLFFNILGALGFTAIIYSLGGIEATYLTPIYAALIAYLGVLAPQSVPFIIAGFCAFFFCSVVLLEGLGIIPGLKVDPHFNRSLTNQFIKVAVVMGLLFIVAYISSFTAGKLKHGRDRLRRKNKDLEEKSIQLENSQSELKVAHNGLKTMIAKLNSEIDERKKAEQEREKLINELENALKEIKTLRGILPLCSFCKKIRNDKGYWEQVDVYIQKHLQADVSHSVCPDCAKKHYSFLYKEGES
ncbi:membrane hypothetical protein [Desulfosarcina cetonica]|nr:membrane hypothetical protein [Desulfosarcina cetonica]